MWPTLFLMATLSLLTATSDLNCTRKLEQLCQGKGRHVLCQYPEQGPGETCRNYTKVTFGSELRSLVTDFINSHRQNVAAGRETLKDHATLPQPEFMTMVEWDDDLAFFAQRLADQCRFMHDECRASDPYRYAGQTVGVASWGVLAPDNTPPSTEEAARGVLRAWWGEGQEVTPERMFEPFSLRFREAVWGDFTQLCLSFLTSVGCGAARLSNRLLLVCDYSHTNMLGESTLLRGPLGACPEESERGGRYPLLCTKIRERDVMFEGHDDTYNDYIETSQNTTEEKMEWNAPKMRQMLSRRDRLQTKAKLKTAESRHPIMKTTLQENRKVQKFKKMREKQLRPGPSALLKTGRSRTTLLLDKEDIDQLFQDTGFRAIATRF